MNFIYCASERTFIDLGRYFPLPANDDNMFKPVAVDKPTNSPSGLSILIATQRQIDCKQSPPIFDGIQAMQSDGLRSPRKLSLSGKRIDDGPSPMHNGTAANLSLQTKRILLLEELQSHQQTVFTATHQIPIPNSAPLSPTEKMRANSEQLEKEHEQAMRNLKN